MRTVTVRLEPLAKEKIVAFAEAVKTEIGGLMSIRREGTTLTINDAWTIPQEVTDGSVDFEPGHFEDHIKAQGWLNGRPMPHICMGIWHSHVDMPTGMSSIDENDLVRKYALRGFLVNLVVNRKGEFTCQVDSMVGPENGTPAEYVLVTVPNHFTLVHHRDPAILDQVTKEIAANVKARPIVTRVRAPNGQWANGESLNNNDFDSYYNNYLLGKYTKHIPAPSPKDQSIALATQDGSWTYNKKKNTLDFHDSKGRIIKRIENEGRGRMTLYDEDGKVLMTTNSHTGAVRGKVKRRFWPMAEL